MVVISYIQPGHMQFITMDERKQIFPLIGQCGEILKIPAALTGHFTPDTHILTTIVMDGDTAKIEPVHVATGTLCLSPRTMRHTKGLNQLLRSMLLAGE